MTNNKVIIDGVEVSNCIAYDEKQCYGSCKYKWCKDNPNCSFKQLARKTQECEKLKKELMSSEKWRISAENALEKLDLKIGKLKSALEEIEETVQENCGYIEKDCNYKNILRIINKAKGGV